MQQPRRVVLVLVHTLSTGGLYDGIFRVLVLNIGYFLGLFGSISLYRACFHLLRNFPGPPLAKLSTLWSVRETACNYRFHVMVDEIHRTYGDFVCIRPREISINNVDALREIHSRGSVCTKGPYYDPRTPFRSIPITRGRGYHSQRMRRLPGVVYRPSDFVNWSFTQFNERGQMGQSRTDLFTYILGERVEKTKAFPSPDGDLAKDTVTAVLAGGDTVSSALSATLYLLAGCEEPSCEMLLGALFLNGCINEALRLFPPVPDNLQRLIPPGGATIAGRFIPSDTIVSAPTYSLHRDPRNFPNAHAFIPTRRSNPDSPLPQTQKDAFSPFSPGLHP